MLSPLLPYVSLIYFPLCFLPERGLNPSIVFQIEFFKQFIVFQIAKYHPSMLPNLMPLLHSDDTYCKIASLLSIEFGVAHFIVSQV